MKRIKSIAAAVAALALIASGCSSSVMMNDSVAVSSDATREVYSGSSGKISVSGMSDTKLTVSYSSSKLNYARLYVSEGNGLGLILANQDMNYSDGVYSYTVSHPTFTADAQIHVAVLVNDGSEKCIPQGVLSDASSWTTVVYGKESGNSEFSESSKYSIISKISGKSLDNDGWSKNYGTNIIQWSYGGSQENQQWTFVSDGNGYYLIKNIYSGYVLDVANGSLDDGANVWQWEINNTDAQKWKLEKLDDGYYKIINKNSSKVLDVAWASTEDGANIQQCAWNGSGAQRWKIDAVGTVSSGSSSSGSASSGSSSGSGNSGSGTSASSSGYTKYMNNESLVSLTNGLMTMQFKNNTNGAWSDSDIYITAVALNSSSKWCYLTPAGELIPISAGATSSSWSYTLEQLKGGIQMPAMSSGRLYISMGSPVYLYGILAADGNIGIVQPDLNNSSDANHDKYFDWIEFTLSSAGFWGNTTQVDQFSFPVVMAMYNTDGYFRSVGVTESRESIFSQFESLGDNFGTLVQRPYRIIAPCKGQFRVGRNYGTYMSSYVDECWDYYLNQKHTMKISHPLGDFTGYSTSDGKFVFYCTSTNNSALAQVGKNYYVKGKPNNDELFEGSGVLASPSDGADGAQTTVELALQAWVCAALNRHIFTQPESWSNPSAWYKEGPANFYASFWHQHNIDGAAYGFCYDDVFDQSSLIQTGNPRGLVIGIGW